MSDMGGILPRGCRMFPGGAPYHRSERLLRPEELEAGTFEFHLKGLGVESIVERMFEYASYDGVQDEPLEHLLAVEGPAGTKDPLHLGYGPPPVRNMVNDAEVEHGVVGGIRRTDRAGVTHPEPYAASIFREPMLA